MKNKTYRQTPVGTLVGKYIRWFRNEWGATRDSIRDYESVLARMSISVAEKEPEEVTTEDLREVIDLWSDREPRTRKVHTVAGQFGL